MYEVELDPGPCALEPRARRDAPTNAAPKAEDRRPSPDDTPDFEAVWALHGRAVFERCLFVMAGRRDDADEAYSRASLVALRRYAAHRGGIQNVRHWLLRLAHNVCMDLYRERTRQERLCDVEPAETERAVALDGNHRPADPETALLEAEQLAVLRRAIAGLAPRLRVVLELRLAEQLPDRGIAEALHLTEATVRKRLQEARAALKPVLLAYRRGETALPITNPSRPTSIEREPERLAGPAGDRVGRLLRPPRARASANAERR
jgi:RNA polymerase sigma-70 factor (ECF subfamily)